MTEQEKQTIVERTIAELRNSLTQQDKDVIKMLDSKIAESMKRDSCGWVHQKDIGEL